VPLILSDRKLRTESGVGRENLAMRMNPHLFEAFIMCPTKSWLRSMDEDPAGNPYAEWSAMRSEAYRAEGIKRLIGERRADEIAVAPASENLKAAAWRLAVDVPARAANIETRIAAIERVPSAGRSKTAQFVPIRFAWANKLGRHEKLLLAFDALALSETLGFDVLTGKIICGDDHSTLNVKVSPLVGEVRKLVEQNAALLSNPSPPDLVLNRHCVECEFQARCWQKAVEIDDLSLLATMTEKERKQFHSKGIFTVTQLSYTFRPRRRPKRMRDKREKYHHALKALAIREKKIHVVGTPEVKLEGTPVYIDVEGLPDRNFYYLIGVRIGNGDGAMQHNLWADAMEHERSIWSEFLRILATVEMPVLIHYGSYETVFLRRMGERYGRPLPESAPGKALAKALNLHSAVFAQAYFPTFSNSLKEIAGWLGHAWPEPNLNGLHSIVYRHNWEVNRDADSKIRLIRYNTADCKALELIAEEIHSLNVNPETAGTPSASKVVHADALKGDAWFRFGKMEYALTEFECINKAAYWNYQREKVQLRPKSGLNIGGKILQPRGTNKLRPTKTIVSSPVATCPRCNGTSVKKHHKLTKTVQDLKFTRTGLRRTVVMYVHWRQRCTDCDTQFSCRPADWPTHKEGNGLFAFVIYQLIEQRVSIRSAASAMSLLFALHSTRQMVSRLKDRASALYQPLVDALLRKLIQGHVIHADETDISLVGHKAFVWVFCNADEAVYHSLVSGCCV
jgi:predicted RecB family nuclease